MFILSHYFSRSLYSVYYPNSDITFPLVTEHFLYSTQIGLAVGDINKTLAKAEGKKVALEVSIHSLTTSDMLLMELYFYVLFF